MINSFQFNPRWVVLSQLFSTDESNEQELKNKNSKKASFKTVSRCSGVAERSSRCCRLETTEKGILKEQLLSVMTNTSPISPLQSRQMRLSAWTRVYQSECKFCLLVSLGVLLESRYHTHLKHHDHLHYKISSGTLHSFWDNAFSQEIYDRLNRETTIPISTTLLNGGTPCPNAIVYHHPNHDTAKLWNTVRNPAGPWLRPR